MTTNKSAPGACGLWLLLVVICSTPVAAQDAVLSEFYGSGVHHYFAGNYSQAIADLGAAIDNGSRDPRAYYFRGLAKSRSGYGGDADFQTGAALETSDSDQYYPVGKALERVQGSTRMRIERFRALARATAMSQQRRRDAQRYEQLRRREKQVLRAPMAAPAGAVGPTPPVAEPAVPNSAPRAEAVAQPAVPPAPMPEPPAAADPFADDAATQPAAAPPAAAADAAPTPPVANPPAAEMPADESPADDPFADPPADDASEAAPDPDTPEEDDPFADS